MLGNDQDGFGGGFEAVQAFLGDIDELRIWGSVRSPEEIAGNRSIPVDPSHPDLRHYWRFDELEDLGVGEPGPNDVRDLAGGAHLDLVGGAGLGPGAPSTRWQVEVDASGSVAPADLGLEVLPDRMAADVDGHRIAAKPAR